MGVDDSVFAGIDPFEFFGVIWGAGGGGGLVWLGEGLVSLGLGRSAVGFSFETFLGSPTGSTSTATCAGFCLGFFFDFDLGLFGFPTCGE